MERDFTYIDDIVDGVFRLTDKMPQPDESWKADAPDPGRSSAPYRLYNIGNSQPVPLMQLISVLENCLGVEAKKEFLPMQPGDVPATYADIDDLAQEVGFQPRTGIETGVAKFVAWYQEILQKLTYSFTPASTRNPHAASRAAAGACLGETVELARGH